MHDSLNGVAVMRFMYTNAPSGARLEKLKPDRVTREKMHFCQVPDISRDAMSAFSMRGTGLQMEAK